MNIHTDSVNCTSHPTVAQHNHHCSSSWEGHILLAHPNVLVNYTPAKLMNQYVWDILEVEASDASWVLDLSRQTHNRFDFRECASMLHDFSLSQSNHFFSMPHVNLIKLIKKKKGQIFHCDQTCKQTWQVLQTCCTHLLIKNIKRAWFYHPIKETSLRLVHKQWRESKTITKSKNTKKQVSPKIWKSQVLVQQRLTAMIFIN